MTDLTLVRSSYISFITTCKNKVDTINESLDVVKSNKTKMYELITTNAYRLNTISVRYDTILDMNAIIRLYNNDFSNYRKDIATLNKMKLEQYRCFERQPLMLTYLLLFATYCRRQRDLALYIEPFAVFAKIPFITYRRLFMKLGTTISQEILKGGYYSFGRSVGKITVVRKHAFFKEGTTCSNVTVDWGASNKLHDEIVIKHDPELYKKYKDGYLFASEYRRLSRKYVYDKTDNPNGEKWHIVRVADYDCWWYWFKSFRMSNLALYWFTPTKKSNIHNYNKTLSDLKFNTVDDIINNDNLSNITKLANINKQFNNHTLRYEQI